MCSAKESKNESNKSTEEKLWNTGVSSADGSLNDSVCLPREDTVNVAVVHTSLLKEGRTNLQLKHHGYLAIRGWVLIQNPGEEHRWRDPKISFRVIDS